MDLANQWALAGENDFYYIDGHVQVYNGYQATLGKKHVSRQKLCLPGVQEFWINDKTGMPYFYITGEVNEKLLEMLDKHIIPALLNEMPCKYSKQELENDPDLPRFTLVFDREAYSPVFFQKLWDKYRIAVLTYRKNVKGLWAENDFQEYEVEIDGNTSKMQLAEKAVELNGVPMREVRRLSDGHQTSVITTNKKLSLLMIALFMFARWTQENFFKYMRQDYDFDRMLQYAVEQIDGEFTVNNPEYSNLTYKLGKLREKISRRKALLFELMENNINDTLDKASHYLKEQAKVREELQILDIQEKDLFEKRAKTTCRIKIKDMPEHIRYTKLNIESKHFQNIIKIICYRAETSFANLLAVNFKKDTNEKRALAKSLINSTADILPDYTNNKLNIKIYSQANPRMNHAIEKIIPLLNDCETVYPGTNLVLNFQIAT